MLQAAKGKASGCKSAGYGQIGCGFSKDLRFLPVPGKGQIR
jgi:hypothetical protein